jgi:hypothetical protein
MTTMNRFFLDANNGAFAFKKIDDIPDTVNSTYTSDAMTDGWNVDPISYVVAGRVLNVENVPEVVLVFKRSDPSATFSFNVLMGINSTNLPSPTWFVPDDGAYVAIDSDRMIAVNCRYSHYISIDMVSVSVGSVAVEIFPMQYEEST